ncbi:MAG: hypothetical protein JWQ04_1801 [Pedosphaera sp.]|nr:hypothetical protein [Pedosphaera sp.]
MDLVKAGAASGLVGKLLGELPLSKVQTAHISFIKDQVVALEKENATLNAKMTALEKEVADLKSENSKLKAENVKLHNTPAQSAGTECKLCGNFSAKYVCTRPSSIMDYASIGLKEAVYKCSACGGEFEKQLN